MVPCRWLGNCCGGRRAENICDLGESGWFRPGTATSAPYLGPGEHYQVAPGWQYPLRAGQRTHKAGPHHRVLSVERKREREKIIGFNNL